MNDGEIIRNAYRNQDSSVRSRKGQRDMFEDALDAMSDPNDAIAAGIKRKKAATAFRRKTVSQWTYTDFLRHLDSLLSVYDMSYERASSKGDVMSVGQTYDLITEHLQHDMSNYVLKEYYEWWVNMFATRMHGKKLYTRSIGHQKYVDKFLSRYSGETNKSEIKEDTREEADPASLFELGGLSMVMMSYGIVVGHRILKERKEGQSLSQIARVLQGYDKDVLDQVMMVTIRQSPYPHSDKVDFISLARQSLQFFNLKEYTKFQYETYFNPPIT